jgi:cyclic beta-1,2-glucan synthetase
MQIFSGHAIRSVLAKIIGRTESAKAPLRGELFSAWQMEQHGKNLATEHAVSKGRSSEELLSRLDDNERVIFETCDLLADALRAKRQITPASEWLLDNQPLIEEQIRIARKHLPKGYSRGLPRLSAGNAAGLPRVYDIALETISHGDARVDPESLTLFVSSYQSVTPLTLGELWAIPIMLRLALIENLRRIAAGIAFSRESRNLADLWADRMAGAVESDPTSLVLIVADMSRSDPPMNGAFIAELTRRLQGHGAALSLPLTWVEQRLAEQGTGIEQTVNGEIRQQATEQVSVANSIVSLRFLSDMDWRKFVESQSVVEHILLEDPAGQYGSMDFATRDRYRHAIERIAKYAHCMEQEVASRAVELCKSGIDDPRHGHVGFYLIDKGCHRLEEAMTIRLPVRERLRRTVVSRPLAIYLAGVAIVTGTGAVVLLRGAFEEGLRGAPLAALGFAAVIASSRLGVALINWLATLTIVPHRLPRLDFSEGLPESARTLVAVPTLLTGIQSIDALCDALEIRFLANRGPHVHFCLLTDFADAKTETQSSDMALLNHARERITALNLQYANGRDDLFFLFHRPRLWNESEGVWMGRERKRGKLGDLNALLRGRGTSAFSSITGNTDSLAGVKYVMTLDTDTQLPRDAVWQCAGVMAHPLNRPVYDEKKQRIVKGYGILQPRIASTLPGDASSRYAHLFGGEPGIDPYTRAVSDVYQDAFGEGSFIGKGMYDVDAFERSLEHRFPDNRILSHDLLEGCYARSALLSDVELYEEYPSLYTADVSRRHRWIRGDWQIAGWLLPFVAGPDGTGRRNTLSALSRWKIFDNLRRSVVPLSLALLLLYGWVFSREPGFWLVAVLALLILPAFCASFYGLARKPKDVTLPQHILTSAVGLGRQLGEAGFMLACLPYEAFYNSDAILRTFWRMLASRKRLLEWTQSSEAGRRSAQDMTGIIRRMWIGPVSSVALCVWLSCSSLPALENAAPVLMLWLLSPLLVWTLSQPPVTRKPVLTDSETAYLGKLARKTWAFFEAFVGPDDHCLPPDNIQELPVFAVAHRTSPTNMGLALLANLTAADFGYIPMGRMIERTEETLRTMGTLDHYRGHFYNWYDTVSLVPLNPRYVSAVDSGNLAGHLMVLHAGLLAQPDQPVINFRLFQGLRDTFDVLADTLGGSLPPSLRAFSDALAEACQSRPQDILSVKTCLEQLAALNVGETGNLSTESQWWLEALGKQCQTALDDMLWLMPWANEDSIIQAVPKLNTIPTLRDLATWNGAFGPGIDDQHAADLLRLASLRAADRIEAIQDAAMQAAKMAEMDWDFLYDKNKHLLSIGYHVDDHRIDPGYYDLLASEARLGCFTAIAQGLLPQEAWFALGRQMRAGRGKPILVSWSGSMFEYLMPLIVMPDFDRTLLHETYKEAVRRQVDYGTRRGIPWGISESGYYAFDAHLNYQYRAFGVPGIGMKRDLGDDLVIAPYATAMALMVDPESACRNLQLLSSSGFEGRYGLYEAVDYTSSRIPPGKANAVVQSYMAHHQGMSFLSLSHALLNQPMPKRFSADPQFQAAMLLLHEKIPKAVASYAESTDSNAIHALRTSAPQTSSRTFTSLASTVPDVNLLSNGRYHVMVTNAGGGFSRWRDLAITRWREDSTRDNWGAFCYIADVTSGLFWSSSYQPTLKTPDAYEVTFTEGRAEFRRRDGVFQTVTEMVVSPEDDIELRRVRITNRSHIRRTIEVTSYAEAVLAPPAADAAHPAFSNLFVQTEILHKRHAILCTRRPRSFGEQPPWMVHVMALRGAEAVSVSYETDRMRFIGRGQSTATPQVMRKPGPLSGSEGSVLDPIVAIRYRIYLEPNQTVTFDLVTGAADTREAAEALVEKYQDSPMMDRVLELAWTHAQVILRQINATEADAQLYAHIAGHILYPNASLRTDPATIVKNHRGQSGLWSYAISGDIPIVLVQITALASIDLVRRMVQAHAYWRLKGLAVDLVIWNEDNAGYRQLLQDQILGLIAAGVEAHTLDRPGGIFVRPGDQISMEDRVLLESVASVILTDAKGTLEDQMRRPPVKTARMPHFVPLPAPRQTVSQASLKLPDDLQMFNGFGGFTPDGREYIVITGPDQATPAPWSNVIANPEFGTVISERGQSYTWGENAHEFRLSPWHNDPVGDPGGETFYIRDEDTGVFWSPMPGPCRSNSPYLTKHGFGYSVFEHIAHGIHSEMTVYVAIDAAVKFSVLKLRNLSGRSRRLSATGYVEWVLADLRPKSKMHVVTEIEPTTGAILARNAYNADFRDRVAFFDADDTVRTITGDRREFIGRNGTLDNPSSLGRTHLSGKTGAALDPCAAIMVPFELADGQSRQITFRLGIAGRRANETSRLIQNLRGTSVARATLDAVHRHWAGTLGSVQIDTPDRSLNILANGWLMYQTVACRLWARSGYYQSGGAYGFRDQLQDGMALIHTRPDLLRAQLLLHAAHQFVEGDVQHWWHPPTDRGVRTKCSDDYLWLPLAVCRYVKASGDTGVLNERIHFIEGRALNAEEESYYDLPSRSTESASLYEHCLRAIEHGFRFGAHGLPLIGSCDWNDGMDKVGQHGKGESVWLGFFLYDLLLQFKDIAVLQEDAGFAVRCDLEAGRLRDNIEAHAWDGGWYRRAYFDDGTPLGSAENPECQIDSLSQSWSVLSGAGDPERSRIGMAAVDARLVRRDYGLIQLLDPPFDTSDLNPGYIRGYVPGVRENGGQYTHAAIWTAMAFAKMGDHARAFELLRMINPLNHALTRDQAELYKVEPYVVTADIYGVAPHSGRGGWSWYTGSSGWLYRLILESILGVQRQGNRLQIVPCMPPGWDTFSIAYKFYSTLYAIRVVRVADNPGVTVDWVEQPEGPIQLIDDGRVHEVEVRIL